MADDSRFFFLNLTAANVKGGSKKVGHLDWLELTNWHFAMHQNANPNAKGGRPTKTSATGKFSFDILHNGPALFQYAAKGAFIDTPITFEAERAGIQTAGALGTTLVYLQLIFNRTVVSHRSIHGDDGQKQEHIELVFEKVAITYKPIVNGMVGSALQKSFDAKSNKII